MTSLAAKPVQPLLTLWQAVEQAHFLQRFDAQNVFPALQIWREQVQRLYPLLLEEGRLSDSQDEIQDIVMDHLRTLLETELRWLERVLDLRTVDPDPCPGTSVAEERL